MSSGTTNTKNDDFKDDRDNLHPSNFFSDMNFYDVSNIIVSFLNFSKRNTSKNIYPEGSKTTFKDIDPELQNILKQEFMDVLDDFLSVH